MTPNELIRWLKNAGIQVNDNPLATYAEVRLTDDAYVISLGREYHKLSPEQQVQVLLHELGHIIRGDLLAPQMSEDAEAWNIATDSVINESLNLLHDVAVTYGRLREWYPQLPDMLQPASVTYSLIRSQEKQERKSRSCNSGSSGSSSSNRESDGDHGSGSPKDPDSEKSGSGKHSAEEKEKEGQSSGSQSSEERHSKTGNSSQRSRSSGIPEFDRISADYRDRGSAEQVHNRTIVDIVASYHELPDEYKNLNWGMNRGGRKQVSPSRPIQTQSMVAAIDRVVRRVIGRGGSTRAYKRTYRRERYGIPLRIPVPSVSVLLAIDVSQSLANYYESLRYIASTLSRRYHVSLVAWDVSWEKVSPYGEWPRDRGTDIRAAYDAIRAIRPDIAVIVTDGAFQWFDPQVACPIIWVITPDGREPVALRPSDISVRIQ